MNILFYQYGSICEPDLIEAFSAICLEAVTITEEITNKNITDQERISLVANALDSNDFLFVFSVNFYPVISEICKIYQKPYVSWVVDAPVPELFSKSILNDCNRTFCFDGSEAAMVSKYNPDCVFHLPLGTNVSRWDKVLAGSSSAEQRNFSSDISFVGSLYTEKDPISKCKISSEYLEGYSEAIHKCQQQLPSSNLLPTSMNDTVMRLLKKELPAFFPNSSAYVKDMDNYIAAYHIMDFHISSMERFHILSGLSQNFNVDIYTRSPYTPRSLGNARIHGGVSTHKEMPLIFHNSKINLNITINAIETGISLRVWDIMGCGGFLMTNFREEMLDYFVPGQDFDFYTDLEDLKEKCEYYLKNDDIRKRIAFAGYEKVRSHHTYINRMPEIISKLL